MELGAILRESYEAQDWQTLNYKSFADYVEDTLKTSKSEAYDLIRLARISERYPHPMIIFVNIRNRHTLSHRMGITDADAHS